MSDELNLDISELRRRRRQNGAHGPTDHDPHTENGQNSNARTEFHAGSARTSGSSFARGVTEVLTPGPAPFNFWLLLEVLLRRWTWVVGAGAACALFAFLFGLKISSYTAKVMLIRQENPNAFTAGGGENAAPQAYLSRELSAQTLFALMRSPEVFKQASLKARPPARPDQLSSGLRVLPERNADFVTLAFSGKQPKEVLAAWANVCADEVVTYTKELQAHEAALISDFLRNKLRALDLELTHINREMADFSEKAQTLDIDKEVEAYTTQAAVIDTKLETSRIDQGAIDERIRFLQQELAHQTPANDRLQSARDELERLRARGYSDKHPEVIMQKALIAQAEQKEVASTNGLSRPGGSYANALQLQIVDLQATKAVRERELQQYENLRTTLQEKAKRLSKTAVGYLQLKAGQKRLEDLKVTLQSKQEEAQLLKENAMGYFRVHAYASPSDVGGRKRLITVLFLGIVGGLLGMLAAAALALVAEALDHRIKSSSDLERATRLPVLATLGDLRSMTPDEQISWAFRTLTLLQGKLNSSSDQTLVCGFISSHHGEGRSTWINLLVSAASQRGMRVLTVATRPSSEGEHGPEPAPKNPSLLPVGPSTTLTKNVLAFPAQVVEQFSDPQAQPIVHIPLPGWVWNLDRRRQWRSAVENWENIDNLVLLIELPPASQPESVLLAEHLPQVIWLADSGTPDSEETRKQIETLRHARCNLVGAVLNREPSSFIRKHLGPWLRRFSVLLACTFISLQAAQSGLNASEPQSAAGETNRISIGVAGVKRAPWQERLTLGPGDTFDFSLFHHPEVGRTNLMVGPDGRVSFLQVQDLPVAGLTVDELRARLETVFGPSFIGGVRAIVVPTSFNSKKYFVLGKVMNEGVFVLDRPLTVIEAVARAKGLQTGTFDHSTAEVADLSHSFLARQGKRVHVDFEKLFYEGDWSQNIQIEPNDYLYFAPASPQEIYVLGEVFSPGRVVATPDSTVLTVLANRGGFTPRAYKKRVLVVRGSLQRPQAFAVDAPAILAGRIPDFKLQPKDIVYVNQRPWIRVEDLLDVAAQSFIESAVTFWVGENVPAAFTTPVIPGP